MSQISQENEGTFLTHSQIADLTFLIAGGRGATNREKIEAHEKVKVVIASGKQQEHEAIDFGENVHRQEYLDFDEPSR